LSALEYVVSLLTISAVKLAVTTVFMVALAYAFYSFNIFKSGLSLIPLIANLVIMGWSIGIITVAIILRFGAEAEVLAWGLGLLFQPLSAVFYPVSVLPGWLKAVAVFVPSSHVFEGMRHVISTGAFPLDELIWASCLNAVYIIAASLFFSWNFSSVKEKGLLAKVGE
jgi:ABC-2 type transport system permease protein